MKTSRRLLACLLIGTLAAAKTEAQCTGGITPTLLSYDSTVTGVGSAPYIFTFPKFNPSLGTLTSVRIQSVVTLLYTFSLENSEADTREVEHYLNRLDRISSPAFSTINNSFTSDPFGPYNLSANDGVPGSGADYVKVTSSPVLNNDTMVNRTLFSTANFMGPGTLNFNYTTIPGSTTYGASVNHSPSITDVIKFNITYVYCSAAALASNSMNLSVENAGPLSASIKWTTSNEKQAKSYEVMVSDDGKNFTTATIIPADARFTNDLGSYQFKYEFSSPVKQLYFRIKQLTKNNKIEVTAIKPVSWQGQSRGMTFIPDPSGNFITTNLPTAGGTSWKIDLYATSGQLIDKYNHKAAVNAPLAMKQKLQKGVYIVRAINNSTHELITQKIVIQ